MRRGATGTLAPREQKGVDRKRNGRRAGPNNSVDAIKNVSETETLASIAEMLNVNEPVRIASVANRNHASGCGPRNRPTRAEQRPPPGDDEDRA